MMKKICVFCGSAEGRDHSYTEMAFSLGEKLALNNFGLVYGGASIGVMGSLADGALARNGKVWGVMPKSLIDMEVEHAGLSEFLETSSMHERKQVMYDLSDAFLALPGGMGTLDELFEIATWSQIGLHHRPIYLYNFNGFFDHLVEFLKKSHEEKFIRDHHFKIIKVVNSEVELWKALENLN